MAHLRLKVAWWRWSGKRRGRALFLQTHSKGNKGPNRNVLRALYVLADLILTRHFTILWPIGCLGWWNMKNHFILSLSLFLLVFMLLILNNLWLPDFQRQGCDAWEWEGSLILPIWHSLPVGGHLSNLWESWVSLEGEVGISLLQAVKLPGPFSVPSETKLFFFVPIVDLNSRARQVLCPLSHTSNPFFAF
jgi:hypothetical protein